MDNNLPEECKTGNYMDLKGPDNKHRFIDYTVDFSFDRLDSHDRTEEFDFKWFRFNLEEKATRMLERNDVSDLIMKEKVCVPLIFIRHLFLFLCAGKRTKLL